LLPGEEQTLHNPQAPASEAELVALLRQAIAEGKTIIPCGNLSCLPRVLPQPLPPDRTLISAGRLNRILDFNKNNFTMRAEAGVTLRQARAVAEEAGLNFPLYKPGWENRSLAGLYSSGASGIFANGNLRDLVLGIKMLTPDGSVIHSGGPTVKDVSGYDFTRLGLDAAGSLGMVLQMTLRLQPAPEEIKTLIFKCDSINDCAKLGAKIRQQARQPLIAMHAVRLNAGTALISLNSLWKLIVTIAGFREVVEHCLPLLRALTPADKCALHDYSNLLFQQNWFTPQSAPLIVRGKRRAIYKIAPVLDRLRPRQAIINFIWPSLWLWPAHGSNFTQLIRNLRRAAGAETVAFAQEERPPNLIYTILKQNLDPNRAFWEGMNIYDS
jgi:FAD/FMN-containing dehydrogenase